nr:hypothetical protein Cbor_156 [Cedratvirus borely]
MEICLVEPNISRMQSEDMSKDDHGMFVSDKHGMSGDKPIFIFDLDDTLVFYNKKGAKVPREVSRYFSACSSLSVRTRCGHVCYLLQPWSVLYCGPTRTN